MKDSSLLLYLERKVHDMLATVLNPLAPVRILDSESLPSPRELSPRGNENLEAGRGLSLEAQFYDQQQTVQNVVDYRECQSYRFEDVHVAGDQGYIYVGSQNLVSVCEEVKRIKLRKARRPIKWLRRKVDAPVFHLTGNNHESHGHFVLQHLPRLMAARDCLLANNEVKLLLAPNHLHWQRFYLERLGFGPERLLEGTPGTLHCCELEYIPFYHGQGNLVASKTYRAMRDLLAPDEPQEKGRFLFLSRKGTTHRALLNEEEVFRAVRYVWPKMELIDLKDFSSAEQVGLFQSARVVFGPHGQAFTNMLYTRDALMVVASASKVVGGWSAAFRNLAIQMGGTGIVLNAGVEGWKNMDNWNYPPDRLRTQLKTLQSMLPDKYR